MKTFIKMIALIVCAEASLWCSGGIMEVIAGEEECIGWNCEEVYCPEDYAVRVSQNYYLPCNDWDKFEKNLDASVLIRRDK